MFSSFQSDCKQLQNLLSKYEQEHFYPVQNGNSKTDLEFSADKLETIRKILAEIEEGRPLAPDNYRKLKVFDQQCKDSEISQFFKRHNQHLNCLVEMYQTEVEMYQTEKDMQNLALSPRAENSFFHTISEPNVFSFAGNIRNQSNKKEEEQRKGLKSMTAMFPGYTLDMRNIRLIRARKEDKKAILLARRRSRRRS